MSLRYVLFLAATFGFAASASAVPDYRLTATPEQTQADPGDAFNVDWRVVNVGSDAPETIVGFYFSSDPVLSSDDLLLDVEEIDDLESGEEEDGTEGLNAPDLPSGYYYLIVAVDPDDAIGESSESDNVAVFAFTLGSPPPGPDLAVTSVTVPGAPGGDVEPGTSEIAVATIRNEGPADASATTAAVYVSDDATLSDDDVRADDASVGPLAAGEETTVSLAFSVPADQRGRFYVLVRADDDYELAGEADRSDNVGALALLTPGGAVSFTGLFVEDFDVMGTAIEATLPDGWSAGPGSFDDAGSETDDRGGNNYTFGQSGVVNFGSGPEASAGDRALGLDFPYGYAYLHLRNETGAPFSQVEVGYIWELYGEGLDEDFYTRTRLAYSFDGDSWVDVGWQDGVLTDVENDDPNGYYDAPAHFAINRTGVVSLYAAVEPGEDLYLRFSETGYADEGEIPGSSSAPVLGLDNVFVSTTPDLPFVYRDHAERAVDGAPVGGEGRRRLVDARYPVREGEPRPDIQVVLGGENPDDFIVEPYEPEDPSPFPNPDLPRPGRAEFLVSAQPMAEGPRQAELTFVVGGYESEPVLLTTVGETPPPGFPTGPGPDLLIAELEERTFTGLEPVGRYGVEATVTNYGARRAEESCGGLYFSDDEILSDDDVPLYIRPSAECYPGGLSSAETYGNAYRGTLPVDAEAGTYYAIAVTDVLGQVDENSEANNTAAIPIEVTNDGGPDDPSGGQGDFIDIRVDRVEVAGTVDVAPPGPTARAGETVPVRFLLANTGGIDAPATELLISLEGFPEFCYETNQVDRIPVAPLAAGTFRFVDYDFAVPLNTAPDQYYVCAEIDPDRAIDQYYPYDVGDTQATPLLVKEGTPGETALSGTYGIPSDFATLTDAVAALSTLGVRDAVRIELAAGTYTERFRVGSVPGASAEHPVVITSASGDPADVRLAPPPATTEDDNYIVQFDGPTYVELSGVTFRALGADYHTSVVVTGEVVASGVTGSVFEGPGEPASAARDGVAVTSRYFGFSGDGLFLEGNTFMGVTAAIDLGGSGAGSPTSLRIRGNTITGVSEDAISLVGMDAPDVSENVIEVGGTFVQGITLAFSSGAAQIRRNRIVTGGPGIDIVSSNAEAEDRAAIVNNFVVHTVGQARGVSVVDSDHWDVLHNSVVSVSGTAFSIGDNVGLAVKNNVFSTTGFGSAYEVTGDQVGFESGTNALSWSDNSDPGRVDYTAYPTLSGFLDALDALDPDGTEGEGTFRADPAFADVASGDLHSSSDALQGAGLSLGVPVDFDGQARSQMAPDIGADESGSVDDGAVAVFVDGGRGSRFFGTPAAGLTVDDLAAQNLVRGVPGFYPAATPPNLFTEYDASGPDWYVSSGSGEVLELGKAFRWYMYDRAIGNPDISASVELPFTLSTDRPVNTDDVTVELQTDGTRFNYLANPFGQPLDLSGLFTAWPGGGNLASPSGVQVYDDAARTWVDAPSEIGPWVAFRVRSRGPRRAGNPNPRTLTIPAAAAGGAASQAAPASAARTASPAAASSAAADASPGLARLAFALDGADADGRPLADHSFAVVFADEAEAGLDDLDAPRDRVVSEAYAALGARHGDALVGVDVRPFETAEVPLAVGARGAGEAFTLSWDAAALPDGLPVVLVDLATGAEVDVRRQSELAVVLPARPALDEAEALAGADAEVADRFVLRIGDGAAAEAVTALALDAPAPNPTSGPARVTYAVPEAGPVRLAVYDVRGREVAVLADGPMAPGRYEAAFDGARLAAGVYVLRLSAGGEVVARRAAVVR